MKQVLARTFLSTCQNTYALPCNLLFFLENTEGIQNKIPSTFYLAKILIYKSTLWTRSSWLVSKTKGKYNRYVWKRNSVFSKLDQCNTVFFQGFHTACNQLVDQRLQRGKRLLSNMFLNNALCEKHDSKTGKKNRWRCCANIATQILQMPKQLRTHRRILPPLLLLPLFQYRPLRSPSLGFPKRYKNCWNQSLKNMTVTQIKHHKKTFHLCG